MQQTLNNLIAQQLFQTWQEICEYLTKNPQQLTQSQLASLSLKDVGNSTDKRFTHPEWQRNIHLNFLRHSYLLIDEYCKTTQANIFAKDQALKKKIDFYVAQYLNSIAPSNVAAINPAIIEKTVQTNGANLLNGLQKFLEDLQQGRTLFNQPLADAKAFKLGENIACTKGKVIFQNPLLQLILYDAVSRKSYRHPILFIPPWVNKYYILDLQPENSLVNWLIKRNYSVFMISWVNPTIAHQEYSFSDYLKAVAQCLQMIEKHVPYQINLVGYCIGGTLLACLLAYLHAKKICNIASATFLTTLLDFSSPGELGVFIDEKQLQMLEQEMQQTGFLSGKILATVFSALRANDLVWSAFINNYLKNEAPKPFDLLYWNDDATNVPAKVHSFYLREMYLKNNLIDKKINLAGTKIDLTKIKTSCYFLAARDDHIIPWQSSYASHLCLNTQSKFVLTDSGHVAGVINPPIKNKYSYWVAARKYKMPDSFLKNANHCQGSWWIDWEKWLRQHAGPQSEQYTIQNVKSIEPAPGSYVKVRI